MNINNQLELLDEIVDFGEEEGKTPFTINDDNLANWALKKIKLMEQERDRKLSMADYAISEYTMKKDQIKKEFDNSTLYFRNQLANYFETVEKKSTKTKDSYALLHGKLIRNKNKVEFVKDDVLLTKWLKNNDMNNFVKVTESADWAGLKKITSTSGNSVVTSEGEVVEGIVIVNKPDEFKIELDK